ncbi:MAG: class I SAM-dependent methyltransferase [Marmoricola sp.]
MDLATAAWLVTPAGQQALAAAEALLAQGYDELRAGTRLRRTLPAEQAAGALTQAVLRRRAVEKFLPADAARMYFTPDGLEQATRHRVAVHRASRLVAAGTRSLIDLGCGIGGDLIASARAGLTVAGVDLDPVRAQVAAANLGALGLGGVARAADATTLDTGPFDVAFADPARRGGRGRTFQPEDWTPSWDFVLALLHRDACVKVAPGIPHETVPPGVEAEWVSDDGDLKEAALWSGRLATTARRATVIRGGGLATLTDTDEANDEVRAVGRFLYEPDDAVIRAGLVTVVAAGVQGGLVDPHLAYVTSDASFTTPLARSYEILEELPHRERPLREALRARGVGPLTIKKRGVQVVPEDLRRRLALSGEQEATIVLTRAAGRGVCWLVRPFGAR